MAEPTSGHWVIERSERRFLILSKRESKDCPILIAQTGSDIDVDEANARLIAAAPELLRACLAFVDWDENPHTTEIGAGALRRIMAAAIAKASAEE